MSTFGQPPENPETPETRPRGRGSFKDIVPLRTYVIVDKTPASIQFSRHMLRFLGLKPFETGADLLWGVQGTASLNKADSFASRDAAHLNRRVIQVEILYRLNGLPAAGSQVTEEYANEFGYMHLSRLASSFRKSTQERMIAWLTEAGDVGIKELMDLELEDLVRQRPMLIHRLMAVDKHLHVLIHPVLLPGNVSLRIATVRNIPEKIDHVQARVYQDIVVTI